MKKKNVIMRVASALGLAVLLTTCAISGTFAKYTASDNKSDTARVAKFGVTVTANGEMFETSYAKDGETDIALTVGTEENTAKLVAPGTKGTLASTTITGTPEVAVRVTYDATLTLENWTVGENELYCPLVIKVGNDTYGIKGMKDSTGTALAYEYETIAEYETAVKTAIAGYNADYAAGKNLSEIEGTESVSVSWEWAFDKNDNAKDTALGDAAATNPETAPKITLQVTTTVTQID